MSVKNGAMNNSVRIHPSAYHGTPDFTSLEMGRKDDGTDGGARVTHHE